MANRNIAKTVSIAESAISQRKALMGDQMNGPNNDNTNGTAKKQDGTPTIDITQSHFTISSPSLAVVSSCNFS